LRFLRRKGGVCHKREGRGAEKEALYAEALSSGRDINRAYKGGKKEKAR